MERHLVGRELREKSDRRWIGGNAESDKGFMYIDKFMEILLERLIGCIKTFVIIKADSKCLENRAQ